MNNKWMFVCILVALAIGGCATGYQSHGLTGGYSEKKINDSTYVVSFNGNGYASKDRVWYFWIYRCAELTSEKGYQFFSLRQNAKAAVVPLENSLVPAVYNPDDRGQFINVRGGGTSYIYVPGTSITTWNSSATVLMFHDPLPDEVLWAFSSKAILEQLKPYVTSNGGAPALSRSDILKHAFSTRDRIELGDRIKVSAAGAFAAADAPAGMRPRSASSVQTGVDFTRLLMLQAGYREYSLRNLDALGGQVVLAFVIAPTGIVQDARVVSTTFRDRGFVDYILNVIRQTNFGPGDFGDTRVNEFPISFFPKGSAGL